MAKLQGSVLAGLDKCRSAKEGTNQGGHIMTYCIHLFLYYMGADSVLTLWNPYVGVVCCWVRLHGSSVFLHNKTHKAQEHEMESGLFDA